MSTKLIQTEDYLILIDEEAEIKGTPCLCYNSIKNTWSDDVILYQGSMPEYHYKGFQKIIAYHPLTKEAKELDLPLLPEFNNIETRKIVASQQYALSQNNMGCLTKLKNAWIDGFDTAQAVGTFTLEDMKKSFQAGTQLGYQFCDLEHYYREQESQFPNKEIPDEDGEFKEFIQSLSTQQLPKEFIPEYVGGGEYLAGEVGGNEVWAEYPKELKTTTNSEDKEELVGTYKY